MGAMATMDILAMPTLMPTTDTTARGLLMLRLLPLLRPMLMLTMVSTDMDTDMALPTTAMDMDPSPTADTTAMPTPMPTMDITDIPTPTDTTDIINLLIFVKN